MKGFFDMDAPLWAFLTEVADIMILSLYWWVCSLPIITVGASTTSLFYVLGKKMRKESVYVTRDFFHSFKTNFKQSLPISIILIIAGISGSLYFFIALQSLLNGEMQGFMKIIVPVAIVFIFEAFHISNYVCAILSRFHMKTVNIFTTAFVLVHRHLLTTGAITLGTIAIILIVFKIPIIIIIVPGIMAAMSSYFIQKIFAKYTNDTKEATDELVENLENVDEDLFEDQKNN